MPEFSPEDMAMYNKQFHESMELFNEAMVNYQKAPNEEIKAKFKDVMDRSMHIMDELSPAVLNEQGQKVEETLHQDYDGYVAGNVSQTQVLDEFENLRKIYSSGKE